jgi:hypothetical protein
VYGTPPLIEPPAGQWAWSHWCKGRPTSLAPLPTPTDNAAMAAEPPITEPKRKRRWYQFSLWTFLLAVSIAAVLCAICIPIFRDWQGRERITAIAVAEVRNREGWNGQADSPVRVGQHWVVTVWSVPSMPRGFRVIGIAADRTILFYEYGPWDLIQQATRAAPSPGGH